MTSNVSEARFLELCSREGMERLRRECPCLPTENANECGSCSAIRLYDSPSTHGPYCEFCHGCSWVPLPEAERLGALVEVALATSSDAVLGLTNWQGVVRTSFYPGDFKRFSVRDGPTPEVALVEALLAATKEKA